MNEPLRKLYLERFYKKILFDYQLVEITKIDINDFSEWTHELTHLNDFYKL